MNQHTGYMLGGLPLVMSCSQLDTCNEGTPNLGTKCVHAWGLKSLWVLSAVGWGHGHKGGVQ